MHLEDNPDALFRGKVLQKITLEEVREFNGHDGRPLWAYVGKDVFDLSSKFILECLRHFTTSRTCRQGCVLSNSSKPGSGLLEP